MVSTPGSVVLAFATMEGRVGEWGAYALPFQILADQLTISQLWGEAHYAHHTATCPPDSQTFRRPCSSELKFAHQPSE